MSNVLRLAIVDPSDNSRTQLKNMLLGMDVVWLEAECSRYEFFADVIGQTKPDIGIVAIDSNPEKGLNLLEQVREIGPDCALLVISSSTDGQLILRAMRESWLPASGIPASVPIPVAENGWPTSPDRSDERQAAALESIIRTIHDYRGNYYVTHYQLFDLRDADSSNPDIFYQFGILRDDYTPKPAFQVYRRLIAELGGS